MAGADDTRVKALRWVERLPIASDRPAVGIVFTLAVVALGWIARAAADPFLPPGFPYVTFFPAVIVTSFLFGVRLGIVSALLCGLIAWHEFIAPGGFGLTRTTVIALIFYLFVVTTDLLLVHWMQLANRKLAAEREENRALAEVRELLFRELQHRVSNNLQVAAALLALQRRQLQDPAGREALSEAARRLELIGRISRQLYDPSGGPQPLIPFLREIGQSVVDASGRSDVTLTVTGDDSVQLEPDVAVPTALIAAEAVANAIEHGFANDRAGQIEMLVDATGGDIAVTIADDGRGLPPDFDVANSDSLGLKIARMMASNQGGQFTLSSRARTEAVLRLPTAR